MKPIDASVRILVVDEDEANRSLIRESLAQLGNPTLTEISDLAALRSEGVAGAYDIVVTSAPPGEKKSLRLYERIGELWPDTPLLVIAEDVEPRLVAAAMARGVSEVVPRSGDVAARLALHLEARRLRRELHPGEARASRSIAFYEALCQTVGTIQAATSRQMLFEIVSSLLKAFDLKCVVLEFHPDQTFTIAHAPFESEVLKAIQRVASVDLPNYVGRTERFVHEREILTERRTVFVDDVTTTIAGGLGFRGAKPIASRVRAVMGVSEMIVAPLVADDRVAGMLAVMGLGNLTPSDVPFVNVLATQISARWQALSTREGTDDRADQLRLVAQISREAAAFPDLEPLLYRALRRLHAVLPGEFAAVALIEGDYAVLRIESHKGETYQPTSERGVVRLRVGKEGIIGHVAGEGKPILANDVRLEPRYRHDPDLSNVRSELAVPMRFREEIVGVLDLEANELAAFSQEHVDLTEAVAGQLAAVIVTARSRVEVEDLTQALSALTATTEALASPLALEERLARITEQARQAIGAEGVTLHLLGEDRTSLAEVVAFDRPGLSETVAGLARRVALSNPGEVLAPVGESGGDWCLLSAPLRLESRSLGAITLARCGDCPFAEGDRERLNGFASQAAVAVSLARLLEQNNHQKQLLETLGIVSRVVGSSLDLDEVLEAILNALNEIVAYTSASIMLFEAGRPVIAISRNLRGEQLAAHDDVNWAQLPTIRHLMAQRRPLVVSDTTQDERWRSLPASEYIKSWIGVPLVSRGNMIGVLNVNSDQPGHYQPADGIHLMAFANQIATALNNALLFGQAEERQIEARALYEATRVMVSGDDPDEIVERLLTEIHKMMPFDVGALLWVSGQTPEEPHPIKLHTPRRIDDDLSALAWQHITESYSVLSNNLVIRRAVQRDLRSGLAAVEDERLPSQLSVPLLLGDRLLGMIELYSVTPDAYDESDLRLLFTIANSLATALENASLLDALLARADELEEANHLREEMVQNISHELRNPLTFIRGYVDLLAGGDLGPLTKEQNRGLAVISDKTDVLVRLADELVTLNVVAPGALRRKPQDLRRLVEEAVRGVEGSASTQGLSVRVELPDSPQVALVDSHRLNQVIDNLLSNALKFSEEGGTIVARAIDLGARVRVEIEDQGVGIPPEAQSRVFDRFFRGDGDARHKHQGVGLGMAIAKEIVEAHGGLIGLNSAPGQGSTFYFELEKHTDG